MAWRIVVEGEGDTPPSIKPWVRSVMQSGTVTTVTATSGQDLTQPTTVVDLLATIEDGD